MERGRRIELLALAWKAKVLPLYEPRIKKILVPQVGLEPTRLSALASKTSVATITPPGQKTYKNTLSLMCFYMVPNVWFEQTTYRLQGDCTTAVLIRL